MPTFYGPPSDGTVIPSALEDALAADLDDSTSVIGATFSDRFSRTSQEIIGESLKFAHAEAVRAGTYLHPGAPTDWTLDVSGTGAVTAGISEDVGAYVTLKPAAAGTSYRAGRVFKQTLGGGKFVSFLVRRDNAAAVILDLYGALGATGLSPATRWNKTLRNYTPGKWYRIAFSVVEQMDSGVVTDRLDLRQLTAMVTSDPEVTNTVGSVSIADFQVHQGKPGGKVSLFFDDGRLDTYTEAFTRMQSKGFPGSVAIEHDNVGSPNRVSLAQLDEMYDAGWDVAGHHHLQVPPMSEADQRTVHENSKAFLSANGFFRGSRIWVWPGGVRDDAAEAIASDYWPTLRRVGSLAQTGYPHVYAQEDPPLFYMTTSKSLAAVTEQIDKVNAAGASVVFVFHSVVASPVAAEDVSVTTFQGILDHLEATGTDVVPASQIWSR